MNFFIRLEKPNVVPIFAPFDEKNSKQDFSQKNHISQFEDR